MSNNDVTVIEREVEIVERDPKIYNRAVGKNVLAINIKCMMKTATKGNKFNSIKGYMYLPIINDEGFNEGKKGRWLDVHFKKEAFKGSPKELEVSSPEDLTTGTLYVKASGVQAPTAYRVKPKLDKDGKEMYDEEGNQIMKYPQLWISTGIVGFEPYVADQSAFDYVAPTADAVVEETPDDKVDPDTGEIMDDEPCEIKSE